MNSNEIEIPKLCIVGDSNVGKTCIINRLIKGIYSSDYEPTIGNSFMKRTFFIDGHSIEISIWDTAGQERYRSVVSMYFRNCKGALIVYDITNIESFTNLDDWIKRLKEVEPDVDIIIVGNKEDLEEERKVSADQLRLLTQKYNCDSFEVSAKTNTNIKEVFDCMARKIYQKQLIKPSESKQHVDIVFNQPLDDDEYDDEKKKKCC